MPNFPIYKYEVNNKLDSGLICIKMIAEYFGKNISNNLIETKAITTGYRGTMSDLIKIAEAISLRGRELTFYEDLECPFIMEDKGGRFQVVYKKSGDKYTLGSPFSGQLEKHDNISIQREFLSRVLQLEATPKFFKENKAKSNSILSYLVPYKAYYIQILLGLLVITCLQFIAPLLTQMLVDKGISNNNLDLINLILIALIVLQVGKTIAQFIRSWINLHIGTRMNLSIVSDFLSKLSRLPIGFFENRSVGDILQRISEHKRIERFLTGSFVEIFFLMLNLLVFGGLLAYYNLTIFWIFLAGSGIYLIWIMAFLKLRRFLDTEIFQKNSANQSILVQFVQGVQELKLLNYSREKRREWEENHISLFKAQSKMLMVNQLQSSGSLLINEIKSLLITYIVAKGVVSGEMTFGMMIAVQYIIGQASVPISRLVSVILDAQMAIISFARLEQIHERNSEFDRSIEIISEMPENKSISFTDVNYKYSGANKNAINGVTFEIPERKITAIVGPSGCGKTTLVKMILKLYKPDSGNIYVGGVNFRSINTSWWRDQCGAILTDSIIFEETILKNIILDKKLDNEKLIFAAKVAHILEFVEEKLQGFNTVINNNGNGLSQGQKQRILIARMVYRDPQIVIFDEATNSLDTENEINILKNLKEHFFVNKTVIIITHKKATASIADKVVVMNEGRIKRQITATDGQEKQA